MVAIKVVELDSNSNPQASRQLAEEVRILAQCRSELIVAYKGTFIRGGGSGSASDGTATNATHVASVSTKNAASAAASTEDHPQQIWIVMEYCAGGSLCDLMAITDRVLTEAQIAAVMRMSLQGLAYFHASKHLHRDIKGGNILLTSDGVAKLSDFGVSAQISANSYKRKTLIGSPYWMAPEVLTSTLSSVPYNEKADIWSLGCCAIELATGDPPFHELHPMKAIFAIPSMPPPRLAATKPMHVRERDGSMANNGAAAQSSTSHGSTSWSVEFQDFVARCLTKDPHARPSAMELLRTHPFVTGKPFDEYRTILRDLVNECMPAIERYREIESRMANKVKLHASSGSRTSSRRTGGRDTIAAGSAAQHQHAAAHSNIASVSGTSAAPAVEGGREAATDRRPNVNSDSAPRRPLSDMTESDGSERAEHLQPIDEQRNRAGDGSTELSASGTASKQADDHGAGEGQLKPEGHVTAASSGRTHTRRQKLAWGDEQTRQRGSQDVKQTSTAQLNDAETKAEVDADGNAEREPDEYSMSLRPSISRVERYAQAYAAAEAEAEAEAGPEAASAAAATRPDVVRAERRSVSMEADKQGGNGDGRQPVRRTSILRLPRSNTAAAVNAAGGVGCDGPIDASPSFVSRSVSFSFSNSQSYLHTPPPPRVHYHPSVDGGGTMDDHEWDTLTPANQALSEDADHDHGADAALDDGVDGSAQPQSHAPAVSAHPTSIPILSPQFHAAPLSTDPAPSNDSTVSTGDVRVSVSGNDASSSILHSYGMDAEHDLAALRLGRLSLDRRALELSPDVTGNNFAEGMDADPDGDGDGDGGSISPSFASASASISMSYSSYLDNSAGLPHSLGGKRRAYATLSASSTGYHQRSSVNHHSTSGPTTSMLLRAPRGSPMALMDPESCSGRMSPSSLSMPHATHALDELVRARMDEPQTLTRSIFRATAANATAEAMEDRAQQPLIPSQALQLQPLTNDR